MGKLYDDYFVKRPARPSVEPVTKAVTEIVTENAGIKVTRGRTKTGLALSPAEKQRAYRERKRARG